jgi:hypothetical protein
MDDSSEILANSINPKIWVEEYHDSLFRYAIGNLYVMIHRARKRLRQSMQLEGVFRNWEIQRSEG